MKKEKILFTTEIDYNLVKNDLEYFSFYKSNEKDFETVKKRLINYFKGGI